MVGTRSSGRLATFPIGELLQRRRRELGVSLRDVSAALNMPPRQLEAIERGDFSVFAAEVYARGACVKYAQYLGISHEVTERAISRALTQVRERVPLRLHTTLTFFERLLHPHVFIGLGIALAVLIIGGYMAWQVESFFHLPDITLTSDLSGHVDDSVLVVAGMTERGARISVNGEGVLTSPDSTFSVELTLHPGINVIRIEAENAASRRRVLERHVLFAAL